MRKHHAVALVCLSAAIAAPALADEAPPTPIVVTGRGLEATPATPAYGVEVIDRTRINSTASGRIEDVLADVAGFQQFRRSDSRSANPSAQGVTLRALGGNATSRSLVLLDGVPMADPLFGYIPFSSIDPGQLARVRVTRGGGSGAFGAGAVAGTIELDSANADELGVVSGHFAVDGREETELSATIAPRLGEGYVVASGRWDRGQGFWTTPENQRNAASVRAQYESWSAGLRGVAPLNGDLELQFRGLVFDDHRTLRFAGADSRSEGQDGSVRVIGHGRWQFEALGYVQARNFGNVVINAGGRKTLDQRRTPSTGIGGKFEVRPPVGGGHVLKLGADYRLADGRLFEEAYSAATGAVTARRTAGGRNADIGVFAEDDWTKGPLVLTAGLRGDHWAIRDGFFRETNSAGAVTANNRFADRAGWDTTFRGGAVLSLGKGLALRASAYEGIRLPTLNELYRPFVVFPIATRANAALRNERLRGVEAGFDLVPAVGTRLSVTLFDNRVRDAVANVTLAANVRERRNVDAIRSRGAEIAAEADWRRFALHGSLAVTDAKVRASGASLALDGKRPAQTPRVAGAVGVDWRPADGWLLSADLRYTGMQYEDDLETDKLPAATVVSAYGELPLRRAALFIRVENIGNVHVVTRNQGGSLDFGAPRTVWVGVKITGQTK